MATEIATEASSSTVATRSIEEGVRRMRRVPVVMVTGYAGVGKTTLVNRILAMATGRSLSVGVIVHRSAEEFGIESLPVSVEHAASFAECYDFGSGCLCCSPCGEMARLLVECANAKQPLDVLLIRTGMLAAPLVFAKSVLSSNDEVCAMFELASIVAVIDPALACRHLAVDGPEWQARAQVRQQALCPDTCACDTCYVHRRTLLKPHMRGPYRRFKQRTSCSSTHAARPTRRRQQQQ